MKWNQNWLEMVANSNLDLGTSMKTIELQNWNHGWNQITTKVQNRVAEFWTIFEFQGAHPTTCSPMVGRYLVQI